MRAAALAPLLMALAALGALSLRAAQAPATTSAMPPNYNYNDAGRRQLFKLITEDQEVLFERLDDIRQDLRAIQRRAHMDLQVQHNIFAKVTELKGRVMDENSTAIQNTARVTGIRGQHAGLRVLGDSIHAGIIGDVKNIAGMIDRNIRFLKLMESAEKRAVSGSQALAVAEPTLDMLKKRVELVEQYMADDNVTRIVDEAVSQAVSDVYQDVGRTMGVALPR